MIGAIEIRADKDDGYIIVTLEARHHKACGQGPSVIEALEDCVARLKKGAYSGYMAAVQAGMDAD